MWRDDPEQPGARRWAVITGDCRETMATLEADSVDSVVCDPPYELGFMGKSWDASGIAYDLEVWRQALRVLKPGGHLLAFSGSRTYHRMACAIEDAGFEIRDQIMWVYGSGFPKSHDVSKAIDRRGGASVAWFGPWFRKWRDENGIAQKRVAALFPSKTGNLTGCVANWELGLNMPTPEQFNLIRDTFGLPFASVEEAEREVVGQQGGSLLAVAPGQDNDRSATTLNITAPATDAARTWSGWGTALKPAHEPIVVARKPFNGTVAANVLSHGTGALNIDRCRVESGQSPSIDRRNSGAPKMEASMFRNADHKHDREAYERNRPGEHLGRWPANFIHDGSDEAVAGLGEAARFFYCPKASKRDREDGLAGFEAVRTGGMQATADGSMLTGSGNERTTTRANHHPTVKPTELMRYLCRLVTPPGGLVLDPFTGSGSTGRGAVLEGFGFIGCELSPEYSAIASARISAVESRADL